MSSLGQHFLLHFQGAVFVHTLHMGGYFHKQKGLFLVKNLLQIQFGPWRTIPLPLVNLLAVCIIDIYVCKDIH